MPNYRRLSNDPDFEALFVEGALASEIKMLEADLRSMDVRDPVEVMGAKAKLAGILLVRDCVKVQAEAEAAAAQAQVDAEVNRAKKSRRWAETFLPFGAR